jgi:predicted SprT family Zn-dependent metalloprotease
MTFGEKFNILQNLYFKTLENNGLPPLSFKLGNTKRALGRFRHYRNGSAICIEISKHYLAICPIEIMEETVLHEVAHYMDFLIRGKSNHDWHWKKCCRIVGANPERTCDIPDEYKPKGKYTLTCPSCNRETPFHRKPKHERSCGKCSKTWNPEYKMILTQNY